MLLLLEEVAVAVMETRGVLVPLPVGGAVATMAMVVVVQEKRTWPRERRPREQRVRSDK